MSKYVNMHWLSSCVLEEIFANFHTPRSPRGELARIMKIRRKWHENRIVSATVKKYTI